MSPAQVALLVVGILGLQVLIWIPVLMWIRRKSANMITDLTRELAVAGEHAVLGPVHGGYRGATAGSGFPFAKGNSIVALTHRRLFIRRLVGDVIEIPVADIVGVRDDKWFLRSYINRPVVIIKLSGGAEVGIVVKDHAAWMTALRARIGELAPAAS